MILSSFNPLSLVPILQTSIRQLSVIFIVTFFILLGSTQDSSQIIIGDVKDERITIDENGVPFYDWKTMSGEYIGKQRNPVIIYRIANEYYKDFLKNDNETSKKLFLNNANWIIENTIKHGNYSIFELPYRHPNYELPIGWHDGVGQGRIINLMLKAHNITNDKNYLNEAKLLSNAFFVDVSDGGLTYKTKNNGWWYEHYAHKDGLHPRVLNGIMFTLLDLYSMYEYTKDPEVKFLFDQGIIALRNDISKYDFFSYTYYDILERSTTYRYHQIHIEKTKLLHDITNEKIFLEYYTKWESCKETCHFILKHLGLLLREIKELTQLFILSLSLFILSPLQELTQYHTPNSLFLSKKVN